MFRPARILVPTDMSERSDRAVRQALDIAKLYDSEVFIIHVVSVPTGISTLVFSVSVDLLDRFAAESLAAARNAVESQLVKFRSIGNISIKTEVRIGVPRDEILKEVQDKEIDLLVLFSEKASGPARYLMGSVAEHLLREAGCNVLMVS